MFVVFASNINSTNLSLLDNNTYYVNLIYKISLLLFYLIFIFYFNNINSKKKFLIGKL